MASLKRLQAVAHDIAHHSRSGLSFIHPHLGKACREASVLEARVELLSDHPYPVGLPKHEPLALALGALRQRMVDILSKYDYTPAQLTSAEVLFSFEPDPRDDYSCTVRAAIRSVEGRMYERALGHRGDPAR